MGRLSHPFRTGRPDSANGAPSFLIEELTKVDPAVHHWYRIVYVCRLVFGITGSVGSGLIPRTGTARGGLGRHATLAPDGSLVITHRLEVFQQASCFSVFPYVTALTVVSRSTMLL